jgi:hypothetical protein
MKRKEEMLKAKIFINDNHNDHLRKERLHQVRNLTVALSFSKLNFKPQQKCILDLIIDDACSQANTRDIYDLQVSGSITASTRLCDAMLRYLRRTEVLNFTDIRHCLCAMNGNVATPVICVTIPLPFVYISAAKTRRSYVF